MKRFTGSLVVLTLLLFATTVGSFASDCSPQTEKVIPAGSSVEVAAVVPVTMEAFASDYGFDIAATYFNSNAVAVMDANIAFATVALGIQNDYIRITEDAFAIKELKNQSGVIFESADKKFDSRLLNDVGSNSKASLCARQLLYNDTGCLLQLLYPLQL